MSWGYIAKERAREIWFGLNNRVKHAWIKHCSEQKERKEKATKDEQHWIAVSDKSYEKFHWHT